MRSPSLVAAVGLAAILCACAGAPASVATPVRVSADYEATGAAPGMRAFVYGARTVLELPNRPLWLAIQDENGVTVPYEREGNYYRLARKLARFTVWTNTRVLHFEATARRVAVATEVPGLADANLSLTPNVAIPDLMPVVMVGAAHEMEATTGEDASALLRLAAAQLDEVRRAIAAGADNAAEARALNARLDRVEAQLVKAATIMVCVQFDTASTEFAADERLVRALVPAAKAAQRVNIRGRTDARIAGPDDARIALGRALAARRFLVERGVDGRKINVFALAAGRFLAPIASEAGRALNRRVEIELVDRRHARLALQAMPQRGAAP